MKIKVRSLLCLIFSSLYVLSVFFFGSFETITSTLSGILNAAAPLSLIVYILMGEKDLRAKRWIAPVGFLLRAVTVFSLGWSSAALTVYGGLGGSIVYFLFTLQAFGVLIMTAGTFFDFESPSLLKLGSNMFIAAAIFGQIIGTAANYENGRLQINAAAIAEFAILILFHIGISLFAEEKRTQ